MKRALGLAVLLAAVACGKGSTTGGSAGSDSGGSAGAGGSSGSGNWGCLNTGGTCVCQTNAPAAQYPDHTCPAAPCCYTAPATDGSGQTQCVCAPLSGAQCAGVIAAKPGAQQVSACPPAAATTGTSASSGSGASSGGSGGTAGSGGTSGSTAWGCADETDSCVCKTGAAPADYPLSSCQPAGCCYSAPASGGATQCFCTNLLSGSRCADAVSSTPGATQVAGCPPAASSGGAGASGGTNASSGGSNGSAGSAGGTNASTGGSNASIGGSAGSNGGSNGSLGGSAGSNGGSTGGVGGSAGSAGGTNASTGGSAGSNGGSGGTSASSGTNSSAGTSGSTASTGGTDYGAGSGNLSGPVAFAVSGAFEETGYDQSQHAPTLNFLVFEAPMTCFQYMTRYFPKYYGHLPDGRLVYADAPDAGGLYYPNYSQVLYDRPDGGARYYYLPSGATQDYSGSLAVTAFPKTTRVVYGSVTSPNSSPVQPGSFAAGFGSPAFVGTGYISLDPTVDAGTLNTLADHGVVDYTSHSSSRLLGDLNVHLTRVSSSGPADAGIFTYPDGGFTVPDGGFSRDGGTTISDAGTLTGSFDAVQCSF